MDACSKSIPLDERNRAASLDRLSNFVALGMAYIFRLFIRG